MDGLTKQAVYKMHSPLGYVWTTPSILHGPKNKYNICMSAWCARNNALAGRVFGGNLGTKALKNQCTNQDFKIIL